MRLSFQMNSIRIRMLSGFFFLIALLLVMAIASLYLLNSFKRTDQINLSINQLQVLTLDMVKIDNDFFELDLNNESYFKTHHSLLLVKRDSIHGRIKDRISRIIQESNNANYKIEDKLHKIDSLTSFYSQKFYELERLSFERGFKDYGLEGSMREYAHQLEKSDLEIYYVLTLRRHEKDFLLRHDTIYVSKFNQLVNSLLLKFNHAGKTSALLTQYQILFNQLASIENLIGLNSYHGLRNELNRLAFQIGDQFYRLANDSDQLTSQAQGSIKYFYFCILLGGLLFSIVSAFWISKKLSEPIARLSKLMNDTTKDDNTFNRLLSSSAASEINTLVDSFRKLIDKTNDQMKEIRSKSKLVSHQNKKLKKLNDELDNFMYSTAHDLRSPLASLSGLVQLAQFENRQPSIDEYFDRMKQSIERQEDFILQIVGYAKNKKLGLVIELIDLKELILEIFESHQFSEANRKISLEIEVRGNAEIFSDKGRIQIVFNNLVSNAIRYSDPQKKDRKIKVVIEAGHREINIEFSDNGIGIESEHLDRVFDMFYRANIHSKGSGLGLFILKKTITRLHGTVSLESAPFVGTKFTIRMPNFRSKGIHKRLSAKILA